MAPKNQKKKIKPNSVLLTKDDVQQDDLPLWEKLKQGFNPMVEGVRWTETYSDKIEKIWSKLPNSVGTFIATIAIFLVGSSLKGSLKILN